MITGQPVGTFDPAKIPSLASLADPLEDPAWKRWLGLALFHVCQHIPAAKCCLQRVGLRTHHSWFAGRLAHVRLPNGRVLKLATFGHNYLSFQLFWRGLDYYEPVTRRVCENLLTPGDTFVDCGAQVGFFSLVLSLMKPGISVIAFEPNPRNFWLLVHNVVCNRLENVRCESIAISDTDGTASLYLAESDMSASLFSNFEADSRTTVTVPTTTIDSYFESRPPKGNLVMKVDVEGAEEKLFAGAVRTIGRYRPDIICEVASPIPPDAVGFLKELGYVFYQIADDGLRPGETLHPNVRGDLFFLNYLLSARPVQEVVDLFVRIQPGLRHINFRNTSKWVCAAHLDRAQRRPVADKAQDCFIKATQTSAQSSVADR